MHDMNLFIKRLHTLYMEQLGYKINLFNAQAGNVIRLENTRSLMMEGGIEIEDFFARGADFIQRRDPVGMRELEVKNLASKRRNRIRLAWTTKLLNMSKNQWDWMGRDPAIAAAKFSELLVDSTMQEYLLRSFSVLRATVGSNPNTFMDFTKYNKQANRTISDTNLEIAADMMGDAAGEIKGWIMPTSARTRLLINHLGNVERLFTFDKVNIWRDASGRIIMTTDDPNLKEFGVDGKGNASTQMHWIFGLKPESIVITELDDYDSIADEKGGFENIPRTWQSNWSNRFGVKGYKFTDNLLLEPDREGEDKYISASDAALYSADNWEQVESSYKTTAGVALRVEAGTLIDDN